MSRAIPRTTGVENSFAAHRIVKLPQSLFPATPLDDIVPPVAPSRRPVHILVKLDVTSGARMISDAHLAHSNAPSLVSQILAPPQPRHYDRRAGSGEQRLWEFYNSVRSEGVSTPVVRGMARDITEASAQRQPCVRAKSVIANIRECKSAIYVHDLSGRYVSLNLAAEKLSGYARDEIIGKHFSNFVAPRDLKYVRTNLCKKLDEEGETTYEVDVIHQGCRRVPVELIAV